MPLNFKPYLALIRFDKPIGSILLFWPTITALFIATNGIPEFKLLVIFTIGVFLTRSLGCIANDFCDKNLDKNVQRTQGRPLASGALSRTQALLFAAPLAGCAFALLFCLHRATIWLAIPAVILTLIYPLMKRITHFPQLILGITFNWGILMAFMEVQSIMPPIAWALYGWGVLWTFTYDTLYAMSDREDDQCIGIKSTAILFGQYDIIILSILQLLLLGLYYWLTHAFLRPHTLFYGCYIGMCASAGYQLYLCHSRNRQQCFAAFKHNAWYGLFFTLGTISAVI